MATKLKHLRVKKVDVVDDGANPDAHIMLYKRRDPAAGTGGSAGERGGGGKHEGILKRLAAFIVKAAGMEEDELDSALKEIQKGEFRERLNEMKNRKIADEIWDICYALQASLCSIMNDDELDAAGASAAMQESLAEFESVVNGCIAQWSGGMEAGIVQKSTEPAGDDIEIMKSAVARLTERIEKAGRPEETSGSTGSGQAGNTDMKGENEMGLRIDKSKMSPAERAFYDAIEKRYGVDDGAEGSAPAGDVSAQAQTAPADASVTKGTASALTAEGTQNPAQAGSQVSAAGTGALAQQDPAGQDDIYKGMHPAVREELEQLKKFREEAEDRELSGIAKKYEIIGKKTEELVPLFKSLKAAGGTAYNDMIAVLDQAVDAVEKSGVFSEIGKSGGHDTGASGAEAKIETIAKGYMEKDPLMDYSSAVAKAWENNPDLMAEYEEEAGF